MRRQPNYGQNLPLGQCWPPIPAMSPLNHTNHHTQHTCKVRREIKKLSKEIKYKTKILHNFNIICTFTVHYVTSRTSEHLSSQLTAGQDDPTLNLQYFIIDTILALQCKGIRGIKVHAKSIAQNLANKHDNTCCNNMQRTQDPRKPHTNKTLHMHTIAAGH